MALRIIHTGDLHIGQKLLNTCRIQEHRAMLSWISSEIRTTSASVLLIAGDVFDKASPSAEAQRLFFDWLAELQEIKTRGNPCSRAYSEALKKNSSSRTPKDPD